MRLFEWFAQIDEQHNLDNDATYRYIRELIDNTEGATREVYEVVDSVLYGAVSD